MACYKLGCCEQWHLPARGGRRGSCAHERCGVLSPGLGLKGGQALATEAVWLSFRTLVHLRWRRADVGAALTALMKLFLHRLMSGMQPASLSNYEQVNPNHLYLGTILTKLRTQCTQIPGHLFHSCDRRQCTSVWRPGHTMTPCGKHCTPCLPHATVSARGMPYQT